MLEKIEKSSWYPDVVSQVLLKKKNITQTKISGNGAMKKPWLGRLYSFFLLPRYMGVSYNGGTPN